jgi:phage-related protein
MTKEQMIDDVNSSIAADKAVFGMLYQDLQDIQLNIKNLESRIINLQSKLLGLEN